MTSVESQSSHMALALLEEALAPRPLPKDIDAPTPLHALGIDSLMLLGMLVGCEVRAGRDAAELERRPPQLEEIRTVGDLQRYVGRRLHAVSELRSQP